MEEPKPISTSQLFRVLIGIGFVVSCLLVILLTFGLLLSDSGGDLLFYVLFPIIIPIPILLLILYYFTYVKFKYTHKMVMKQVTKFWHDIYGNLYTEDDINWVRRDQTKAWHPDGKDEDYKEYATEVISRINQILDELKSEVRRTGQIDWSNKEWDLKLS